MIYEEVTLEQCLTAVDDNRPLFCDTETAGLYGKPTVFQCYQEHWDKVKIVLRPCPVQLYAGLLFKKTVWHNAHYDLTVLQAASNTRVVPEGFEDTFLLARLAIPNLESYSLDDVIAAVIGYCPYTKEGLEKNLLQKSNWAADFITKEQILYAALDVYHLPAVWHTVNVALDEPSYLLDKSSLKIALDFQWNGLPIDFNRINEQTLEVNEKLSTIPMPINANSWQQVRKWLNVTQSDKKYLSELALNGNDKARAVLDVRTNKKLLSFLEKYERLATDGRLYGKFKPSARSGRFTSDSENLQQIPRALKTVVGYEEDSDRVLVFADYAQLELRTICAILGVRKMEEMFRDNVDLHGYVASVLFGEDFKPEDRQVTKTYNFNLLYGGSVGMVLSILITYGTMIDPRLAARHKRKWLNLFPEIDAWQERSISDWRKGKIASTPFGRRYKGKLMTDQMNVMNQGAGAEVAKLALHYLDPWLTVFNSENGTDVKLVNYVHDSYLIDCPNDPEIYTQVAEQLARKMQEAWFEMSKVFKIKDLPMPVDVLVGWNWGDLEKGKTVYEYKLSPMETYSQCNTSK